MTLHRPLVPRVIGRGELVEGIESSHVQERTEEEAHGAFSHSAFLDGDFVWQDDIGRDDKKADDDDDCDKVTERKDDAAAVEPGRKQKLLARYR